MKQATEEASRLKVHVVDVAPDAVVLRIDGKRTKIFAATAGDQGVRYVAQLSPRCAWLSVDGSKARISMCEGDTEKL